MINEILFEITILNPKLILDFRVSPGRVKFKMGYDFRCENIPRYTQIKFPQ
jgi:hypothetical protein